MVELIPDVIRKIRKAMASKYKNTTKLRKIQSALDELTESCGWVCQKCYYKWIEEYYVEDYLEDDDPQVIPCPKCGSKNTDVD